jgi:predicted helicase
MRKSPGKKYGYIIIPVVVPSDVKPEEALNDNKRFAVVWTVLNALRAHDDRFNATVNKINLNKKKPSQILIGRPEISFDEFSNPTWVDPDAAGQSSGDLNRQLQLQFQDLQSVVYARMVKKVGDRVYWEKWAKDVAVIAERQIERITHLVREEGTHKKAFGNFLKGLQKNINPSISETEAIEMLSQHIITKPVFEALFEGYSFVHNNAISTAMQSMLDVLESETMEKDSKALQKFYESVKMRAEGIDNAEGKQRIIVELYDKFFKTAFPKMVEQLGIVYTPVEVVDFIIHSVNDVLQQEFGKSISDEHIHVLDPFTGTGTFITRLLQSGLIKPEDLERKYTKELHANELVLLAYYIAAVNIENAYHDLVEEDADYKPFEGIVLTDTFQLGESDENELFSDMFPENSVRLEAQKKGPIRVIVGNPPYSVGQKSANDNAQNLVYDKLDMRIEKTYVKNTISKNSKSLYDAYIKAFRWSTDRLDPENGGIIAFVSNGAWLESNSTDGFRKSLEKEFSSIWVFNLRGNQRTSGEESRKEGGKIFGSGSRTPISITLLVKKPDTTGYNAKIWYHDIGEYLKREEKLTKIRKYASVLNASMSWDSIMPNKQGDWLNHRNEKFMLFIPVSPDKKSQGRDFSFFRLTTIGIGSNRDTWVYSYSRQKLADNVKTLIETYNANLKKEGITIENIGEKIDLNIQKISWSRGLKKSLLRGNKISFLEGRFRQVLYRPFTKLNNYFDKDLNEYLYQLPSLFPLSSSDNRLICISGVGSSKDFSCLITDKLVDMQTLSNEQCLPLFYYEEQDKTNPTLFDNIEEDEYVRRDGISDFILNRARTQYGNNVGKEDIFYYVYGILHSPDYRTTFANDLKKMLPRIPLVEDVRDFWKFSKAGRQLADLHINYENVPAYETVEVVGAESEAYTVEKMRFPKKDQKHTILYNSRITVSNIPDKAYEYTVNGKSAIEWIMERYQVKTDKKSGIKNDPNDWAKEVGNDRYILDLLLSIINVSVQTVDIVENLPKLTFD